MKVSFTFSCSIAVSDGLIVRAGLVEVAWEGLEAVADEVVRVSVVGAVAGASLAGGVIGIP